MRYHKSWWKNIKFHSRKIEGFVSMIFFGFVLWSYENWTMYLKSTVSERGAATEDRTVLQVGYGSF